MTSKEYPFYYLELDWYNSVNFDRNDVADMIEFQSERYINTNISAPTTVFVSPNVMALVVRIFAAQATLHHPANMGYQHFVFRVMGIDLTFKTLNYMHNFLFVGSDESCLNYEKDIGFIDEVYTQDGLRRKLDQVFEKEVIC